MKKHQLDEVDGGYMRRRGYFCNESEWIMEKPDGSIHMGRLIQQQLKADHRSVGWLSREIGYTRNHVYKIFKKPSLDSDLLLLISKAMNFNFFRFYTEEFVRQLKERIGEE